MASFKSLNVVALISGGKDSLFSILHCVAQGHKIVAVANLHPKVVDRDAAGNEIENKVDEDSFIYQTAGHSAIGHFESALGLPLYRRPITGTAVDQSLNYSPSGTAAADSAMDEAEDLFLLLKDVLEAHPETNALSCGAILSNYQRMRVESIAIRLNLIPLAYLWQFPYLPPYGDETLLNDMRAVRQRAIIIKVASGGLDASFLGRDVSDPATIHKLKLRMERFGRGVGALIGEGGEFETLAMDGPKPLWKRKLFAQGETVVHGEAGSVALHLYGVNTQAFLAKEDRRDISALHLPTVFDEEFVQSLEALTQEKRVETEYVETNVSNQADLWRSLPRTAEAGIEYSLAIYGSVLRYSNITGPGIAAEQQMSAMVDWLLNMLKRKDKPPSITSTLLILRNMDDFQVINKAYANIFTASLPPSRVTICCGDLLPVGKDVCMTLSLYCGPDVARQGLHVQSRSFWAPANIGPYSQAIIEPLEKQRYAEDLQETPGLVHMAGQIPLMPASMELPIDFKTDNQFTRQPSSFAFQTALSLQHLWRVGRAMKVSQWTGGLAFLSSDDLKAANVIAAEATSMWSKVHWEVHEEWAAVPAANPILTLPNYPSQELDQLSESRFNNLLIDEHFALRSRRKGDPTYFVRPWLPNYDNQVPDHVEATAQPCFAALVTSLPRGSPVEWWSLGFADTCVLYQAYHLDALSAYRYSSVSSGVTVSWVAIRNAADVNLAALPEFRWSLRRGLQPIGTLYLAKDCPIEFMDMSKSKWNPTLVPCQALWEAKGRLHALLQLLYYPESTL